MIDTCHRSTDTPVREDPAILAAALANAVDYVEKQDPQN